MTSKLSAALQYAEWGWAIHPIHAAGRRGGQGGKGGQTICTCSQRTECTRPGKHPASSHGLLDATTDVEVITDWWTEHPLWNIGLACGDPSGGIVVVDLDPPEGFESVRAYNMPPTRVARSGGGGLHLYYRCMGLRGTHALGPGIHLQATGQYVVLPPGHHVSGGMYEWITGIDEREVTDGEFLRELVMAAEGKIKEPGVSHPSAIDNVFEVADVAVVPDHDHLIRPTSELLTHPATKAWALTCLRSACGIIRNTPVGSRQTQLNKEAYSLGGLVALGLLDFEECQGSLVTAGQTLIGRGGPKDDWSVDEVVRTVTRGLDQGQGNPRLLPDYLANPPSTTALPMSIPAVTMDQGAPATITPLERLLLDEGPGENWTDLSLARRFLELVERHSGQRLVYDQDQLWIWNGRLWTLFDIQEQRKLLLWHNWQGADGKLLNLTERKFKTILALIQIERWSTGFFDHPAAGVLLGDGHGGMARAWYMSDGSTRSPEPGDRNRVECGVTPNPSERWVAFVDEMIPDESARAIVQEFAGAVLFGLACHYERALILEGASGSNGKSVLLHGLASLVPPDTLTCIAPHTLGEEYYRASLSKSRLNAVSELPSRELVDSEALKAAISGDAMQGRFPAGRTFTFRPVAGQIYSCNEVPQMADWSGGFWRRIFIVPMHQKPKVVVPDLAQKILADVPGAVVHWALEGARRLVEHNGYSRSTQVDFATATIREDLDQVSEFINDCLVVGDETRGPWATSMEVYQAYTQWAARTGHGRMHISRLRNRLIASGISWKRTKNNRLFCVKIQNSIL